MAFSDPDAKRSYAREYAARPEVKARRQAVYREWADNNRGRLKENEARRRLTKRAMVLIATTRTRARNRGLTFDLDAHVEDIQRRIDIGMCEITGQPFDLSPGRKFNSPSLDRRDPKMGYTHENIRVVLNLVNAAMGDWGEDVLKSVMSGWLSNAA